MRENAARRWTTRLPADSDRRRRPGGCPRARPGTVRSVSVHICVRADPHTRIRPPTDAGRPSVAAARWSRLYPNQVQHYVAHAVARVWLSIPFGEHDDLPD